MELVFDSKTGKVTLKEDMILETQTVAEKISALHKDGHYLPCKDKIKRTLHKTIKENRAKYQFRPIRCTYGNTGIVLDFKNISECGKYFNSPVVTMKYHLYRNIPFLQWKIEFKPAILNKENTDDQR